MPDGGAPLDAVDRLAEQLGLGRDELAPVGHRLAAHAEPECLGVVHRPDPADPEAGAAPGILVGLRPADRRIRGYAWFGVLQQKTC